MAQNKNVVLIMGPPNTGKSRCLKGIKNQNEYAYLNADLKELPFKDNFIANIEISDAKDIEDYITQIEEDSSVKGAILDTLTFLMGMYERQHVVNSKDTQKAWGDYGNFYRNLIHKIKAGTKDYVVLAHEDRSLDEATSQFVTKVPLKGAVARVGVEADFSTILSTKQVPLSKLKNYENDLLHITDNEKEDGFKYVFCTRISKESIGEKMRSADGLWARNELYIDNDIGQVLNRIKQYYSKN